jgi:hypothetical protein
MRELLFVVERRRPEIYEELRRSCAGLDNVQVILDRRQQPRRRLGAWAELERRHAERRQRKIEEQLASLGFAVVPRDPPLREAPGADVGPAEPETNVFLAAVPLFSGFSPEELDLLAARVRPRPLHQGQVLFHEGEQGEEMFIVRAGRVVISKEVVGRAEEILAVMEPGDFFGEMNVFGSRRRSATARAQTDALLLGLDHPTLVDFVERSPRGGVAFFASMVHEFSRRLGRTDDLVAEVTRWGLEATGLAEEFS